MARNRNVVNRAAFVGPNERAVSGVEDAAEKEFLNRWGFQQRQDEEAELGEARGVAMLVAGPGVRCFA